MKVAAKAIADRRCEHIGRIACGYAAIEPEQRDGRRHGELEKLDAPILTAQSKPNIDSIRPDEDQSIDVIPGDAFWQVTFARRKKLERELRLLERLADRLCACNRSGVNVGWWLQTYESKCRIAQR